MNTTDNMLTHLLTGDETVDAKLRTAYALGLKQGRAADRENLKRAAHIDTTRQLLAALMRALQLDLQTAMITLAIPRKERKTYVKIFAAKSRQKQSRRT